MRGETFRVEKNKNYSVISNFHLRDLRISSMACALLSRILALPDDYSINLTLLVSMCKEGKDAVRRALSELEKCGYIERKEKPRSESGTFAGKEYVIYEVPKEIMEPLNSGKMTQKEALSAVFDSFAQGNKKDVVQSAVWSTDSGKPDVGQSDVWSADSGKPDVGQSDVWSTDTDLPTSVNPTLEQENTKEQNTSYSHVKSMSNNNYIYIQGTQEAQTGQDRTNNRPPDRKEQPLSSWFSQFNYDLAQAFALTEERVRRNINYDHLISEYPDFPERDIIDELRQIIVETICTTRPTVFIGREEKPAGVVRGVMGRIKEDEIVHVLRQLDKTTTEIKFRRAYLRTALYDAQVTGATSFKTDFNYNESWAAGRLKSRSEKARAEGASLTIAEIKEQQRRTQARAESG